MNIKDLCNEIMRMGVKTHFVKKFNDWLYRTPGETFSRTYVKVSGEHLYACQYSDPSGLIHEAAHLAIMPQAVRKLPQGNMINRIQINNPEVCLLPKTPAMAWASLRTNEQLVDAWAFAAALSLGLDPKDVIAYGRREFPHVEYNLLKLGTHPIITSLEALKMCRKYPEIDNWINPN